MTYILGVTGGIGSGKSAATALFEALGITVVDADLVARDVVTRDSFALKKIALQFGSNILLDSGELDRAALRERIFSSPEEKKWLENLLHPLIRETIIERLQAVQSPYGILSSPLLFETQQNTLADRTLVIDCDEKLQQQRATNRDNVDAEQVKKIMEAQLPRQERCHKADDIIDNSGSLEGLQRAVKQYHDDLLKRQI